MRRSVQDRPQQSGPADEQEQPPETQHEDEPEHNPHKLERSPRDSAYDEKRRDNNTKRYKDQFHRYHLHALSTVVASKRYTSWVAQKTPAVSSRSPAQRSPVIDRRLR